jgi:hypothetical protein
LWQNVIQKVMVACSTETVYDLYATPSQK